MYEFERKMLECVRAAERDPEAAHADADDLMCEALRAMGFVAGVVLFEEMPKWYA